MKVSSKLAGCMAAALLVAAFLVFVYPTRYFYWNYGHNRMRQDRFTGHVSELVDCNGYHLVWSDQCKAADPFAAYGGHEIKP